MTPDPDDEMDDEADDSLDDEALDDENRRARRRRRQDAKKERVLHTRVPAVLDQELKRLALNLRVPVSNVVRAILEDAVDAMDTVGERAEGELMGFVDRLHRQRGELRDRVNRPAGSAAAEDAPEEEAPAEEAALPCPDAPPALLDGVLGFQPMILAAETRCDACGRALPAGSEAHRAFFDEPGRRVFLGAGCRLLPGKES